MNLLFSIVIGSVVGSVVFLVLFLLRPITERIFSKAWHYYCLVVPLIFLLGGTHIAISLAGLMLEQTTTNVSPVSAPFEMSADIPSDVTRQQAFDNLPAMPMRSVETDVVANAPSTASQLVPFFERALPFLLGIWAMGAVLFMVVSTVKYLQYRRVVLHSAQRVTDINCKVPIFVSAAAHTPMLIGVIRPIIILPKMHFSDDELNLILAHELVHYERKDMFVKLLMLMANAVHWFNPVVYILNRQLSTACELSCDEKVVSEMDTQNRIFYGQTILQILKHSTSKNYNVAFATNLFNSKKNFKRRLISMMNTKKMKKLAAALSLAVGLLIVGCGAVTANALDSVMPETPRSAVVQYDNSMHTPVREIVVGMQDMSGPRFTFDRNMAFWDSLPIRPVGEESESVWNGDMDEIHDMMLSGELEVSFFAFERVSDYDPTLMYLRSIMNPALADRLWESPYFTAIEMGVWGFSSFFTSDQFVEILEHFGDSFVEDFLSRGVNENLQLIMGNNFDDFIADAAELEYIRTALVNDQALLMSQTDAFVRQNLAVLHGDNLGNFETEEDAVRYFTQPNSMVHFPLPERMRVLSAEGHTALAAEWDAILAFSEDSSLRTVTLNNQGFALQALFEQSALEFVASILG